MSAIMSNLRVSAQDRVTPAGPAEARPRREPATVAAEPGPGVAGSGRPSALVPAPTWQQRMGAVMATQAAIGSLEAQQRAYAMLDRTLLAAVGGAARHADSASGSQASAGPGPAGQLGSAGRGTGAPVPETSGAVRPESDLAALVSRVGMRVTQEKVSLGDSLEAVNALARHLALRNQAIVGAWGAAPRRADLAEAVAQQEALTQALGRLIGARVTEADKGAVTVSVGQAVLVDGGISHEVRLDDSGRLRVEVGGAPTVVTSGVVGGQLGVLNDVMPRAMAALAQASTGSPQAAWAALTDWSRTWRAGTEASPASDVMGAASAVAASVAAGQAGAAPAVESLREFHPAEPLTGGAPFSFAVVADGQTTRIDTTEHPTVDDVVAAINQSAATVRASLTELSNGAVRLRITSLTTGRSTELTITDGQLPPSTSTILGRFAVIAEAGQPSVPGVTPRSDRDDAEARVVPPPRGLLRASDDLGQPRVAFPVAQAGQPATTYGASAAEADERLAQRRAELDHRSVALESLLSRLTSQDAWLASRVTQA
jgi:hypothetical protein